LGLVVDPTVAQTQIDDDTSATGRDGSTDDAPRGATGDASAAVGDSSSGAAAGASGGDATGSSGTVSGSLQATRFHATKTLDPTRPVRDISQISDEILTLFTASGAPVRITVDIESTAVASLTPDQLTALKENLNTLGFNEWNVE
jgi:hypothetical protein